MQRPLRRWMVAIAVLGAVLLLFVNEWNLHRARASLENNDKLLGARIEIRRLQLMLLGAETAQRGYVITGNDDEATRYQALALGLDRQLQSLRQHFGDTPQRQALLNEVEALTRLRLSVMSGIVDLMASGRPEQAMALARSGLGTEHLVQLEALVVQAAATEQARMGQDRQDLLDILTLNRLAISGLLLLSIVAIGLYARHALALSRERAEQAKVLEAERDRLDTEVTRRTQELRELAHHLQMAREDERSHLARELHDELGGLLTAAKLDVTRLRNKLREPTPEVTERMQHLVQTLDTGIALKRRIIEDLRPSTLSNLGLQPALQILCNEFRQRSELVVDTDLAPLRLAPDCEITLFRVLQESLTNITRYAQATRVRIGLQLEGGLAVLRVQDDGCGFDPTVVGAASRGIAGMRFRLESCAGSLEIQASRGHGTGIVARVPHAPPDSRPGMLMASG